jgi:hypothetical protein
MAMCGLLSFKVIVNYFFCNGTINFLPLSFRKKADKKSGRKQPRIGDLSYAAAPDSMAVKLVFIQ